MNRKTRTQALKLLKNAINTLHLQIIEDSQDRVFSEMPINDPSGYKTYYGKETKFRSSSTQKYYQPHSYYEYEEESEEEEEELEREEVVEFQYYFPQVDRRKYQSVDFTPSNMRK